MTNNVVPMPWPGGPVVQREEEVIHSPADLQESIGFVLPGGELKPEEDIYVEAFCCPPPEPEPTLGFVQTEYLLPRDQAQLQIEVRRTAYLPCGATWTLSTGLTDRLEWEYGELGSKYINVDLQAETENWYTFTAELSEPFGAVLLEDFATVSLEELHITSRPYNVEVFEEISAENLQVRSGYVLGELTEETQLANLSVLGGQLRDQVQTYNNWPADVMAMNQLVVLSGEIRVPLISYTNGLPENLAMSQLVVLSGVIDQILVSYTNGVPENLAMSQLTVLSGVLS